MLAFLGKAVMYPFFSFLSHTQDDCISCTGGSYCEGYANSEPTAECMAGWYCSASAERSNDTANGGECQPGTYCPQGSMGE